MNKYIVTYKTLALHNSEIEVLKKDADDMREQIAAKKDHEPLVQGRDWAWVECVRNVVIEADSYSVAANGSAHFYRDPKNLIVSITAPVTVSVEGDKGVTVPKGSGGIGKIPWTPWSEPQWRFHVEAGTEAQKYGEDWYKDGGFPPGTFTSPPEPKTPVASVDLTFKELTLLRQGITETAQRAYGEANKHGTGTIAVDSALDARLSAWQSRLCAAVQPVTERTKRVVIRFTDPQGVVQKQAYQVDLATCGPEIQVDLRKVTGGTGDPVLNPLTGKPLGPGEVIA